MEDCIFCKIIKGEIPSSKVYEDELLVCFKDINPVAPVHVLIVPKKHISSINELKSDDKELIGHIFIVAAQLVKDLGIAESGYRLVTNCGKDGGQTVDHVHFHLLGGKTLGIQMG